jgi:hypothetical protein
MVVVSKVAIVALGITCSIAQDSLETSSQLGQQRTTTRNGGKSSVLHKGKSNTAKECLRCVLNSLGQQNTIAC